VNHLLRTSLDPFDWFAMAGRSLARPFARPLPQGADPSPSLCESTPRPGRGWTQKAEFPGRPTANRKSPNKGAKSWGSATRIPTAIKLIPPRALITAAREALRKRKSLTAELSVRLVAADGQVRTLKRTIQIVR
jgi:hypothetical protein